MDENIDFLQNLSIERRPWRVRVCVVRIWKQPSYSKGSAFGDCLEMVVVDERVCHIPFPEFKFLTNSSHILKFALTDFASVCDYQCPGNETSSDYQPGPRQQVRGSDS